MNSGFETLRLVSETISNMEQLGFQITSEIEQKRRDIEEDVIQKELLPLLSDQIEPVVGWFSKDFVIVVDYHPINGLVVKLSQKKKLSDINFPVQQGEKQDVTYKRQRSGSGFGSKSPSPDAYSYAMSVPELRALVTMRPFLNWKEICEHLQIDVAGDSARRKLKRWVEENKSTWPKVPNVEFIPAK